MGIRHLSKSELDQAMNVGDDLVIVDFFATWYGPYGMLSSTVERMADKYEDVHFYKVDIDEEIDLASHFQAVSVPTLLCMKRGGIVGRSVGLVSPAGTGREIQRNK